MRQKRAVSAGKPVVAASVVALLALALIATYEYRSKYGDSSFPFGTNTSSITTTSHPSTSSTSHTQAGSGTFASMSTSTSTSRSTSIGTSSSKSTSSVGGATLACFANTNSTSASQYEINGTTIVRVDLVNSAGVKVVSYTLSSINSAVPSGGKVGYSLRFTDNSTFTGVLIFGQLKGNQSILGYTGLIGSKYYYGDIASGTNVISVKYLVPEASPSPYVIGATNSFASSQTVSVQNPLMATCGDSWLASVSMP